MATMIHPDYWAYQSPLPVRRVWILKPGTTEQRPLAILPMIDRCKQTLVKFALEAEWEVRFEPHSYGFRPGRSAQDAIRAIVAAIQRQPMFVFDADIAEAFEHVDQAVILQKLQTYPLLRRLIDAWLTAGVRDGNTYSTSETGMAQGGVLSPLLMNIVLHGMEAVVTKGATNERARKVPLLIRFADDFVILHPDLKELQQASRRVQHWLAAIGLQLHVHKTRMAHTLIPYQGQIGFNFLSFHIRQEALKRSSTGKHGPDHTQGLKTIILPSTDADKRHLSTIDQRLQQLQTAPQARVIEKLNPLILGWAGYYHGIVPATVMSRYDTMMEHQLLTWASKRHPGKAHDWLLSCYWQQIGKSKRVFATLDGAVLRSYQQAKTRSGLSVSDPGKLTSKS